MTSSRWPRPSHVACVRCDRGPLYPDSWRNRLPEGTVYHNGRGLCERCYRASEKDGTLCDYPPTNRKCEDVAEEWRSLRSAGFTVSQAAKVLDMNVESFQKALGRARKRGIDA